MQKQLFGLFQAVVVFAAALFLVPDPASAGDLVTHRGYQLLTQKAYLPTSFKQSTFEGIWKVWPEPLRSQARSASDDQRRRLAFERYGLTERPDDPLGQPLQYTVSENGEWTINCFACHGGQVAGRVIPGLPNANFDLQSLVEDMRIAKLLGVEAPSPLEIASLFMPLGSSRGTTNAVMFGVVVLHYRDADLNLRTDRPLPKMVHHAMDAPPWWHFRRKSRLYIDGFAKKGHRALMPFVLARRNGPEQFREWEPDFREIFAYLESLEPPKYPFDIDTALARRGRKVFQANCAQCHGTYGDDASYGEVEVPIHEIGTDRTRYDALSIQHREGYRASWFAHFGSDQTIIEPAGYVAPPLDGVWASAPYLHNGSVPTLWHLMHCDDRPSVWRRVGSSYDQQRVGLLVAATDELPGKFTSRSEQREYYDTRQVGKSAAGHRFPDALDETEKRAVLEYLKSL